LYADLELNSCPNFGEGLRWGHVQKFGCLEGGRDASSDIRHEIINNSDKEIFLDAVIDVSD
jgi:hypothetical protein